MPVLPAIRVCLFSAIILFSIVVLAVLFNFEALSTTLPHEIAFQLGIASAIATVVLLAGTFIVDLIRRDKGVTSMVWFDLVRTFALWALWVGTAVSLTTVQTIDACASNTAQSAFDNSNTDDSICLLFRISQVSTWVITFLAFTWFIVLLTSSNVAVARGFTDIWTTPLSLHPIGRRKPRSAPSSVEDLPGYGSGGSEKFYPSPYGILVSSYEQKQGNAQAPRPPRREDDEEFDFASTTTFTVQTVQLEPPPPAVVSTTSPAVIDLEAQQPQPRRID